MPTPDEVYLDDYATDLTPLQIRLRTHERYSESPDRFDDEVLAAAQILPGSKVLDIGAGTGSFLQLLRSRYALSRACGIDTSKESVRIMAELGLEAYCQDACNLTIEDSAFNLVFARHMLYHVSDVSKALGEAHRVMIDGGTFIATVNLSNSQTKH